MTSSTIAPDAAQSFEQALKELELIVRKLETGQGELEQAINDYARGMQLKEYCRKKLSDARMKVEQITVAENGAVGAAPLQAS